MRMIFELPYSFLLAKKIKTYLHNMILSGKNPWEVLYFSGMILCALRENIFGEKRENEDLLQREICRD